MGLLWFLVGISSSYFGVWVIVYGCRLILVIRG